MVDMAETLRWTSLSWVITLWYTEVDTSLSQVHTLRGHLSAKDRHTELETWGTYVMSKYNEVDTFQP
jgi:hypothetical protein